MPAIDVSELLLDPDFVEPITVIRRRQVMTKGRAELFATMIDGVVASVQPKDTAIGGNVITRGPDFQVRGSNFNVYTQFRLRGVTRDGDEDYHPDVIIWNGDHFLVVLTNDYSHMGGGYIHAEVSATDAVDYPPDPQALPS